MSSRRTHLPLVTVFAVAVLGSALTTATAAAVPVLKPTVTQVPLVVDRGDEEVEFIVHLTNVAAEVPTPQVGETYSCDPRVWQPLTAATKPTFSYQWLRDGVAIPASGNREYKIAAADQGHSLQCQVFGINSRAVTTTLTAPTVVGPAPTPPPPAPAEPTSNGSRPTIAGTGTAARTCKPPAAWSGEPIWTYGWLRNGAPITGATASTYTPTAEDTGKVLQCEATGTNAGGAAAAISLNSPVGTVSLAPANTAVNTPAILSPNWAAGGTSVSVSLPAGFQMSPASSGAASGDSTWSCQVATQTCTNSLAVVPGGSFPDLAVRAWISPAAADPSVVGFAAFGGGALGQFTAADSVSFGPETPFGLAGFTALAEEEGGAESVQAGAHPFSATTTLDFNEHRSTDGGSVPVGSFRDAAANLPAGFVVNPQAVSAECTSEQLREEKCPAASAVGGVLAVAGESFEKPTGVIRPTGLYKLKTEKGYPAELGFRIISTSFIFRAMLRSDGDYGITALSPLAVRQPYLWSVDVTLCDSGAKIESVLFGGTFFKGCRAPGDPEATAVPLLSNRTRCAGPPPLTTINLDSWEQPGRKSAGGRPDLSDPNWKTYEDAAAPPTGCAALTEAWTSTVAPSFEFRGDSSAAATPAGYEALLHVPQPGLGKASGLATSHLAKTTVTLPAGLVLNPAAANGLEACDPAAIGLTTAPGELPAHFDLSPPRCPDASKLGTVEVRTPVLESPLTGSIFLASQDLNPFASRYAIYLAIADPTTGIVVKLPGRISPDPTSGQLQATFDDNPQVPFEDFRLAFFGGPRASLANPDVCGLYSTHAALVPWSAADPAHPLSSEVAQSVDPLSITTGPAGARCPATKAERPFAPRFEAGNASTAAGAYAPLVIKLGRDDGEQELTRLDFTLPPGLSGRLAGIPYCSDAAIEAARGETGKAEQARPSCPPASELGSVDSAAGVGSEPIHVPGHVYLAGPYRGAPVSAVVITPVVAGPFDLGNVVVRAPLFVNPETAQVTAKSDPIPTILDGVPTALRSLTIELNRPGFTVNPTSCEPMAVTASLGGDSGAVATPTSPFQVADCGKLAFKPKLKLALKGGTRRGRFPALSATLTQPDGQANIDRIAVTLPRSEFIEQGHIGTVCTRVQFAAVPRQCPAKSVYGYAEAESPLLGYKLSGPVYLRSSDHKLPDLVAALKGPESQPIEIDLDGRIDAVHQKGFESSRIRNSFEVVPDAPVSRFVLRMQGGKKGLLVNNTDLCRAKAARKRATVRAVGQNDKRADQFPVVATRCGHRQRGGTRHRGR